jgi:hypothetical protein
MMTGSARCIGALVAAAHHDELAVDRARLPARDRRIHEADLRGIGGGVHLARDRGRDGGVIDEDRPAPHAREGAVGAGADAPQVVVVADAGHDELGPRRRLARGARHRPPCSATQASAFAAVRL